LKDSALFKNIDEQIVQNILDESEIITFEKKRLFTEDELKDSIFILLEGMVKSYQVNPLTAKEYTIFLFHKSDVFDIITFVDQEEHGVLFETLEESTFVKISHEALDRWTEKELRLNQNIISLLSGMFIELEQNTTDLALYDTFTRLSKLILKNISIKPILPNELTSKVRLKHLEKFSHEDLANLIGTAREVVSRHLKTLKEKNIIETIEKKHHIVNLQSLIDHCD
jgi:CRP-like cAMP-binding protein